MKLKVKKANGDIKIIDNTPKEFSSKTLGLFPQDPKYLPETVAWLIEHGYYKKVILFQSFKLKDEIKRIHPDVEIESALMDLKHKERLNVIISRCDEFVWIGDQNKYRIINEKTLNKFGMGFETERSLLGKCLKFHDFLKEGIAGAGVLYG